ncbi:MAG TPA: SDR family oxidoreductase [Gemmatimonadaceae bacterium]|nr:SDR family oxidoreductase [Gemmatimonadaceae bacterium]
MTLDTTLRQLTAEGVADLRPERLFGLEGRVAIVTGAGGGIGAWLAAGLAAAGAHVVLSDHPRASLEEPLATIAAGGGSADAQQGDLLEDGAPQQLVDAVLERHGRVDVLVNNAGMNRRELIFDVTRESWDLIGALNLRVPFELSRAAAAAMARAGTGGSIVHIGSLNNAIGLQGVSVYGAHKAGLCQLAKSMAIEWAEHDVRVNALCPGFMLTPLSKPLWDDPTRGPWLVERSLMRRPGYPQELVGACLLLASRAGSFITGQALYVEGGWLAGTPWDAPASAG